MTVPPRLLVCTYHKTGTTLFHRVSQAVAESLGLRFTVRYGRLTEWPRDADIVLAAHSLLLLPSDPGARCVRIIRDPRDILVSGYLYHRHTREGWCVNEDFDPSPPIGWPRVDLSMLHWTERRKRHWLNRLGGRSYQRNLLERDLTEGLIFELEGYTAATFAALREWRPPAATLDVRLEAFSVDYDATMGRVFDHLGLAPARRETALRIAAAQDVNRMDDATLAGEPHIHSRQLSKWRTFLPAPVLRLMEERHGDLIRGLGYEMSDIGKEDRS